MIVYVNNWNIHQTFFTFDHWAYLTCCFFTGDGQLNVVYSTTSGDTYTIWTFNRDTTVNNIYTYKFTCWVRSKFINCILDKLSLWCLTEWTPSIPPKEFSFNFTVVLVHTNYQKLSYSFIWVVLAILLECRYSFLSVCQNGLTKIKIATLINLLSWYYIKRFQFAYVTKYKIKISITQSTSIMNNQSRRCRKKRKYIFGPLNTHGNCHFWFMILFLG